MELGDNAVDNIPVERPALMTILDSHTIDLLRAAALSSAEARRARTIEVAGQIQRWDAVMLAAEAHGVLPLLYTELARDRNAVPADVLIEMRNEFERNAFHCLANAAELIEILQLCEAAGISVMPFKGVTLAAQVYRDITLRRAGDLDLLIFERDLPRATALLNQRGYQRKAGLLPDDCGEVFEHGFVREGDGIVTEPRWRLEMSDPTLSRVRFRRDLGMEWVWPHRDWTEVAGAQVPTLSAEHTVLMVCMHGSKHLWSRLIWVIDVARALKLSLDWNLLMREAKRTGLRTALALGVLLAHRVTGVELPALALEQCSRNREAAKLAAHFEESVLARPGERPEGMLPYNVRLMETRDRLELLLSQRTFRPNQLDRAAIKLPKQLQFLYYVVRPLRILLDRRAR